MSIKIKRQILLLCMCYTFMCCVLSCKVDEVQTICQSTIKMSNVQIFGELFLQRFFFCIKMNYVRECKQWEFYWSKDHFQSLQMPFSYSVWGWKWANGLSTVYRCVVWSIRFRFLFGNSVLLQQPFANIWWWQIADNEMCKYLLFYDFLHNMLIIVRKIV